MIDQNLGQGGNQSMPSRGRVGVLLAIWVETRREERIWTGARTTLAHGRAATLALLREMVAQNGARAPGPRNPHPIVEGGFSWPK